MEDSLISVIVPVYNVEDYLEECIDSLIHQTYKNLEIILIDDGSTDSSGDICDKYASQHSNIVVIHKDNGGLSSARNAGLDVANGYYVVFVDSDDFCDLQMCQILFEAITTDNQYGIVSSIPYILKNKIIQNSEWEYVEQRILSPKQFVNRMLKQESCNAVWGKIYPYKLIYNIKFREGRNNEDTLFMFELSKVLSERGLFTLEIPNHLYYYRIRENSICSSYSIPLVADEILNLEEIFNEIQTVDTELYFYLYKRYFLKLFYFIHLILNNWRLYSSYYYEYIRKLRSIENKYVYYNFDKICFGYFLLFKYAPFIYRMLMKMRK